MALFLLDELKRRNVLRVAAAYAVVAWLLIQVAETIFPLFGFDETPARITVVVLAIGSLPCLIFAWVFEITPEGLKREKDIDRSQSITPQTGKKLDRVIMVVLLLALVYFALDKFALDPARDESRAESARQQGRSEALVESYGDKSIAVLPFVDMSAGKDQEYMSDGIAEELLNLLARIPGLRVISRSSAFSFKGQNLEIQEIARRLNVAHILEGSVRTSGQRLRITAQLIDARSDTQLWSDSYDRALDDIFAVQDEIAAIVVAQLKITLLDGAPRVTATRPEAYALLLQARHLRGQNTYEAAEQAIALCRQALAIDPGYAAAWAELAGLYTWLAAVGGLPMDEGFALAREATARALEIDPDFAPAHAALAFIARAADNDLAAAVRHLERALALDPSDLDSIGSAAGVLSGLGQLDASIALLEYMASRDPVDTNIHAYLGLNYLFAGRLNEAIAAYDKALQLNPARLCAHFHIGVALLFKGAPQQALDEMRQEPFEPCRLYGLVIAHHALDQGVQSDAALAELIRMHSELWAYNIAFVLAYRNEVDRAFEWLDKAVEQRDTGLPEIIIEPLFDNLHDDPRWLPFLTRIGYAPEQLDAIRFEVKPPEQVG